MKYLYTILATPIAVVVALGILLFINVVAILSMYRLPTEILKAIEDREQDRRKLLGEETNL